MVVEGNPAKVAGSYACRFVSDDVMDFVWTIGDLGSIDFFMYSSEEDETTSVVLGYEELTDLVDKLTHIQARMRSVFGNPEGEAAQNVSTDG